MNKKRMKKKKEFDWKYKLILIMMVIVIFVVLLSYSFSNSFLFISDAINNFFYYPFHSLTNEEDIIGKNINSDLEKEISSLKSLVGINSVLSDFEFINGVVISRNPTYWLDEVVINRGSKDGIEEGMAVVVGEGMVGYVNDVYTNSSRITLITNSSYNNTSVRINDFYLILEFDEEGKMIVNQLDNSNSIKEGDVVYTSGLTDKYPSGITIGYISKIEDNTYGTGKKLYISLYYDINALRYVSVLKRLV